MGKGKPQIQMFQEVQNFDRVLCTCTTIQISKKIKKFLNPQKLVPKKINESVVVIKGLMLWKRVLEYNHIQDGN